MLEIVVFILLFLTAVEWLLGKLSKRPDGGFRGVSMGCGLFLVVGMTATGICMWAEPELRDGFTLMFFLWAGFGVVLMVKAGKER